MQRSVQYYIVVVDRTSHKHGRVSAFFGRKKLNDATQKKNWGQQAEWKRNRKGQIHFFFGTCKNIFAFVYASRKSAILNDYNRIKSILAYNDDGDEWLVSSV